MPCAPRVALWIGRSIVIVVMFEERTAAVQVARTRRIAVTALTHYPITVARLRLLNHGFNTIFRVDTADGRTFALRVNVNSQRSGANLAAEMAWLAALSNHTQVNVPTPQPNIAGALITWIWMDDLQRNLPVALFSWLPGADLGNTDRATPTQLRAVGRAAAVLHQHAANWVMPSDAELPVIDSALMDCPNHLDTDHELLSPDRRIVLDAALAEVDSRYRELFHGAVPRPLHADLHLGNLKWHRGQLSVFDFDDSGMGLPMQDLAIAAYYLRPAAHLEVAMLEGYNEIAPLPTYSVAQYEAIVASRNLVLLNDMVVTANADFRALLPIYVPSTIAKLRSYLETGVFRHEVDGTFVRGW